MASMKVVVRFRRPVLVVRESDGASLLLYEAWTALGTLIWVREL